MSVYLLVVSYSHRQKLVWADAYRNTVLLSNRDTRWARCYYKRWRTDAAVTL